MKTLPIFPFPYRLGFNGELSNGVFIKIPKFCSQNKTTIKCRDFYKSIKDKYGFFTCPYGFGVNHTNVNGLSVLNTCLNIEKYSDRKLIQKRINDRDFLPRISIEYYDSALNDVINIISDAKEFYTSLNANELNNNEFEDQKEVLNNTFHELRKLNSQLKTQVENLIYQTNMLGRDDELSRIKYLAQNIFSTTQLVSIRLNTYDFGVNPELGISDVKSEIQIHKKVVKVAHCLREYANEHYVRINIVGESYCLVEANDVLELLPYLLLDNAIKYSLKNKNIEVKFVEFEDKLVVTFRGVSIRPQSKDISSLKERGVRSDRTNEINGQGIGLYLVNYICELNNIDFKIDVGKEIEYSNQFPYSEFIVTLTFNEIIKSEMS